MLKKNIFYQKPFRLLFSFLLVWFVLFEFVLVANGILPKPSSVYNSIKDIWGIYSFLPNILYSFGAITFGLVFSVLLIYFFRKVLLNKNIFTELIFAVNKLKHFIPVVILSAFIIFWFNNSVYIEYIFILIIGFIYLSGEMMLYSDRTKSEYILAAKSLKIIDKKINGEIKFKQLLPMLEESFLKLHFILWSVLITFEFIQHQWGFGKIIFDSLKYRDMPTLFVVALIIYLLISSGYFIIKFLFNRYVHWE